MKYMYCLVSEPEKEPLVFIMDIVFTIGFTFIVIFGTSGNAIVLWIVIGNHLLNILIVWSKLYEYYPQIILDTINY